MTICVYLLDKVYLGVFAVYVVVGRDVLSYIIIFTNASGVVEPVGSSGMSVITVSLTIITIYILVMVEVGVTPSTFILCLLPLLLDDL